MKDVLQGLLDRTREMVDSCEPWMTEDLHAILSRRGVRSDALADALLSLLTVDTLADFMDEGQVYADPPQGVEKYQGVVAYPQAFMMVGKAPFWNHFCG